MAMAVSPPQLCRRPHLAWLFLDGSDFSTTWRRSSANGRFDRQRRISDRKTKDISGTRPTRPDPKMSPPRCRGCVVYSASNLGVRPRE
ncbi:hypothetical protein MA16_Dca021820 [Dendrobium catenatum]|uniref:Uncharacterized protein n=1 Tax=Dendrobium catenatum TaxID=906689 RepID=A0A2I0X4V0_9ASPA|nr:hypothetical protein MA16_Dca021820 [Dendrobium catenatum]